MATLKYDASSSRLLRWNIASTISTRQAGRWAVFVTMTLLLVVYLLPSSQPPQGKNDVYSTTPMCSASGVCGETPHLPSPRTVYSAKSGEQYDMWWEAHAQLNASAASYVERRKSNDEKKPPLILLGDSITEEWLGTNMGHPDPRWKNVPQVLRDNFSPTYDPLVLAIGGDQTQHLLWRMQHGELPLVPEIAQEESAIFVVLIGTNNLGSGMLPGETNLGVLAVAEYILQHTLGRLILIQALPRADVFRLEPLCPPRCSDSDSQQPFRSFMPAVDRLNRNIRATTPGLSRKYNHRLTVADCGTKFVPTKEECSGSSSSCEVKKALMPDLLHPNEHGQRILAKCILDCIGGNCGID